VRTGGVRQWVATVDVDCRCTAERLDDWRLQTFAALTEAHLRQREEFEQAVTALRDYADRELVHRPPAENRRVEQEELKRLALTMLTGQEFELFGAVDDAEDGLPGVALAEATAEGRYIRFFEQAFEWERMSYWLFPYFWARRASWLQRLALDDRDPQFAEFLRAGAGRVLVAARPGSSSGCCTS
jgi:hypothetical protein